MRVCKRHGEAGSCSSRPPRRAAGPDRVRTGRREETQCHHQMSWRPGGSVSREAVAPAGEGRCGLCEDADKGAVPTAQCHLSFRCCRLPAPLGTEPDLTCLPSTAGRTRARSSTPNLAAESQTWGESRGKHTTMSSTCNATAQGSARLPWDLALGARGQVPPSAGPQGHRWAQSTGSSPLQSVPGEATQMLRTKVRPISCPSKIAPKSNVSTTAVPFRGFGIFKTI